jgi:hypothetical protein
MPTKSPRAGKSPVHPAPVVEWPSWWAAHHTADWVAVRAAARAEHPDDERPFSKVEPAMKYGFGAAAYYRDHPRWNHPLEALLEQEWTSQTALRLSWEAVEADVKRGWEMARGAAHKPRTH